MIVIVVLECAVPACVFVGEDSILSIPLLLGRKQYDYIHLPFEISSYKFQGLSFDTKVCQVA